VYRIVCCKSVSNRQRCVSVSVHLRVLVVDVNQRIFILSVRTMHQHYFLTVVCRSYFPYLKGFGKMWFASRRRALFPDVSLSEKSSSWLRGFPFFYKRIVNRLFFGLESVKEVGKILLNSKYFVSFQTKLTHWTKKIIVEEGHTVAQLVHMLYVIVRTLLLGSASII